MALLCDLEVSKRLGLPLLVINVGLHTHGAVIDALIRLDGKPSAEDLVPCHLSTPWNPTNPELAPDGAACLIPKTALKPATTYTVEARGLTGGRMLRWSFRSGRR